MMPQDWNHFLDLSQVSPSDLRSIIDNAAALRTGTLSGGDSKPLAGKYLAMIFDKPSTRTRVSFEVGIRQLGGEAIILDSSGSQMGRGESVADTARVLSRYVDAIMIRTDSHSRLLGLAEHATVPVINGLTDDTHPCQLMADILTFEQHKGAVNGKTIAWTGDSNNVLNSMAEAAALFKFRLKVATPQSRPPDERFFSWAQQRGANIYIAENAEDAVTDADCVITDTWVSMGQEANAADKSAFLPYQVNEELMAKAKPGAIFMHCLPAKRGLEVTDEVMDGPASVVFDEAENRLHVQKSILLWCMNAH
ncbi:MAG: ornithine carbamoyltransferase [Pseudomonadota bacterium]